MMVALLADSDPAVAEFVRRSLFDEATAEQVRDRYAAFELFVARICRLCWYVHPLYLVCKVWSYGPCMRLQAACALRTT
jgi:hypothetical protein